MPAALARAVETRRSGSLLCLGLGALIALGQAPLGWAWVALAALAVALWVLSVPERWQVAAWRGWALGTGYFTAALFWIVEPFLVDVARHGWMAPFALLFMAGGLAIFWALAFGVAARFGQGQSGRAAWAVLALTAAEMLRSTVFTGFPWALIGHIWIGWPQMQFAALAGAHGLTLLTLVAAALPVLLGSRRALVGVLAGVALVALPGVYGKFRVPDGPATLREPEATVRLVQPNAAQHLKWSPEMVPVFFEQLIELTEAEPMPGSPRPDVVIWPETAVPYLLHDAQPAFERTASAAAGAVTVLGVQRIDAVGRWFNSLAVVGPDGQMTALYDKHHLVPFGEYVPFSESLARLGIFGLAASQGGYASGPGPQILDIGPAGKVLPLICYEAIFPNDIARAPGRPDWIVQITNDAWFGRISGPYQHLALARLRAVEQGLPLFRSANTGVSAAFDPFGRETARLPLETTGFVDAALPAPLQPTPYARWGELPVIAALVALALAVAATGRRFGMS